MSDRVDKVEIESNRSGAGTIIKLNGEVVQCVTALDLRLRPDDVNRLTLGIDYFEGTVDAEVEVVLPPATVDLLKSLGWTEPA
jgi:hypothetical protein